MTDDRISRRQFTATAFVAVLSPLIRRFPRILAQTAGRTAWLSALLAALPAAAVVAAAYLLFRRKRSYGEVLTDALGRLPGRAVILLYTLWLLFYTGFLLRSGAERFVSTVYPGAAAPLFIIVAALLCALAAAGRLKTIARTAMVFRPLLLTVLVLALLLTVKDLDLSLLVPVTGADAVPNGYAALQTVNVLSVVCYMAFLGDRVEARLRLRDFVPWLAVMLSLIGAMAACCIGLFGPELTAKLRYPFFMLVRDVSLLGSLERVEPVVIALWVFSDFIFLSLLLHIAAGNLRECFGLTASKVSGKPGGRWPALLCAALAAAAGLLVGRDAESFSFLSETLVPLLSAVFVFVLPIPAAVIGLLRGRI